MRFTTTTSIDPGHRADGDLYVMFHGYGNDESEMIRILGAIDPDADYKSFRGPIHRQYLGGNAWYDDTCADSLIQERCSALGDDIVDMLDSTLLHSKRIIPVGFSQGGYLAYRLLAEHPDIFDTAVLMSPAFHDTAVSEEGNESPIEDSLVAEVVTDTKPRVFLGYGELDARIPAAQQQGIAGSLARFADLDAHTYPGMRHEVCPQELDDIKRFLGL
ncbi:alpha/beta hydrolase [Bifidobacterium sp.]|jgi:phospholipase/carboxylesterase|uniref:alpha/beta hydrolase n=1 Tax=Bifidobacterium sp. TaxID=41200 RepID=UPI0025BD4872|nr:dienelactone hydrolase family protein [Bifidobacterium sp.]MCH4209623.1 prolyl oligopeptidase family serine peptidase [Bifidobacterium sp.]MCI1224850.1 prolyl oligopeptidase family serine peptidase [Bifidobacterium sp.]